MWQDVVDLRDFYRTSLGHVAQRMIRSRLREVWPDVAGLNMLGVGYATPYLRPFCEEAQRVITVMPAQMGVVAWPPDGRNVACIAHESELPLPDLSMDRIVMVHGLECTEQLQSYLREVWRVMADGGRMLIVVPNRRGIWARADHTPFGHGLPYSMDQLNRILRGAMFMPVRSMRALFVPPSRRRFVLRTAPAWEKAGRRWFQPLGGVAIVETSKQIYAAAPTAERVRRRVLLPIRAAAGRVESRVTRAREETPPAAPASSSASSRRESGAPDPPYPRRTPPAR